MNNCRSCETGFGLGSIIAVLLSWMVNHSIIWAIISACFGWLYVIYWLVEYGNTYIH